jgi:hypothetical protein
MRATVVDLNCCACSRSADGFNDFWLASIVPLCDLFVCVTEQVGGPFNAGHVAADFAAKIVLGEPFFDVRIFKQPRHETLPHRIPSRRLAAVFVEIAFALARAKKPGGEINRARGLGLFYRLFERRSPFKDASSASGIHGLVRTHYNSRIREITHSQAQHISATNPDKKLEPYVSLDHEDGPRISFGFQRQSLSDFPILYIPVSGLEGSKADLSLEWVAIENWTCPVSVDSLSS